MLKDVIKKLDSAIPSLFPVDPTQFNDPVAMQTGWKQVRAGKTSRASNKLMQANPDQLIYKPSMGGRIFGIVIALMGTLPIALYIQMKTGGGGIQVTGSGDPIIFALFGLVFIAAGILVFALATAPVVFDKKLGMFYRGRKQQNNPDAANKKNVMRFNDIHAVQLLTRLETSNNTNNDQIRTAPRIYKVHDLNLVRHDGERICVTTYMKADRAREDAARIGAFVNVPVWDGSDDGSLI